MFLHLCVILFTGEGGSVCGGDLHPGDVCIRGGLHPGGMGRPPLNTTGYGQRAGGSHPTGMHSCCICTYCGEFFAPDIVSAVIQNVYHTPVCTQSKELKYRHNKYVTISQQSAGNEIKSCVHLDMQFSCPK